MKDNMKNLREITNLVLKDIYVTEELKNNTLKKCKRKNKSKLNPIAIGLCSAIIVLAMIIYQYHPANFHTSVAKNYMHNNTIDTLNKLIGKSTDSQPQNTDNKQKKVTPSNKNPSINSEVSQNTNSTDNENIYTKSNSISDSSTIHKEDTSDSEPKSEETTSEDSQPKSDINTTQDNIKNESSQPKDATITIPENSNENITASTSPDTLALSDAENYFGGSISVPSYVPENFKLTNIHILQNIETEKIVTIAYTSSENKYFNLTQSKNHSSNTNISGEKVSINDKIQGYIYIYSDSSVSDSPIINIIWTKNNIEYTLCGNISKDSILSIAKSIN